MLFYTFNKSNVAGGEFAYSGTAGRFKHNQIRVAWNDPEDSYKQAIEVVEDIDEIQKSGKIRKEKLSQLLDVLLKDKHIDMENGIYLQKG